MFELTNVLGDGSRWIGDVTVEAHAIELPSLECSRSSDIELRKRQ
jgi:hypothetical protein